MTESFSFFFSGKLGWAWKKHKHLSQFGIDFVGSGDPRELDCELSLPVICIRHDGSPRPPYMLDPACTGCAMSAEYYQGWAEGVVATTLERKGSSFETVADVNRFCEDSFGRGWRVAEHHDGFLMYGMNMTRYAGEEWTSAPGYLKQNGGWYIWTYGNVRNDTFFWAHLNDSPERCWRP